MTRAHCNPEEIAEYLNSADFVLKLQNVIRHALDTGTSPLIEKIELVDCTFKTYIIGNVGKSLIETAIERALERAINYETPEEEPKVEASSEVVMTVRAPCVLPIATATTSTYEVKVRGEGDCDSVIIEVKLRPFKAEYSLPEPNIPESAVNLISFVLKHEHLIIKPQIPVLKGQVYIKATSIKEGKVESIEAQAPPPGIPRELIEIANRYKEVIDRLLEEVRKYGTRVELASENITLSLHRSGMKGVFFVDAHAMVLVEKKTPRLIKISGREGILTIE